MENIQDLIQKVLKMQWSDYLDIIVVAFLIYKMLPLIRTPHIMRIARTVIALILTTWITDIMQLHTINWILDQVLAIGLLAFVVLFQPELRRMIDHIGHMKISSFFGSTRPVQELEKAIAQTVTACEAMSKGKQIKKMVDGTEVTYTEYTGALIVFTKEQRLEEYIKKGTTIDAQVTDQLVQNIFFKNSPLHDGAMIIQDGRIAAAGCVLPLSDSHRLSADLGTRHRAAVGMSEAADAVVVVVSEENGTISVATSGMLKRHLAPQTLEKLLRNELCPQAEEDRDLNTAVKVLKKISKQKENDGYGKK